MGADDSEKLFDTELVHVFFVVHKAPHIPRFCCLFVCFACLNYTTSVLLLVSFPSVLILFCNDSHSSNMT